MQFTGMLTTQLRHRGAPRGRVPTPNLSLNSGIMQLVPGWAFFGNSNVANGLMYYGYINEWSVQYTHWTQFNVPDAVRHLGELDDAADARTPSRRARRASRAPGRHPADADRHPHHDASRRHRGTSGFAPALGAAGIGGT